MTIIYLKYINHSVHQIRGPRLLFTINDSLLALVTITGERALAKRIPQGFAIFQYDTNEGLKS